MLQPFSRLAALTVAFLGTAAGAQDYSPYLETTGRGAFDLYTQAVWCAGVLEQTAAAPAGMPATALSWTLDFAQFLLDTGDVVDPDGMTLSPDRLDPDLAAARERWQAVRDMTPEAADAEALRCLRVFGQAQ
jgi:hypothetical protein